MHFQAGLLLAISIPNFVLGVFILLRNTKSLTNIFFSGIAISGALWSLGLAEFIYASGTQQAMAWAKEYYISAAFIAFFFWAFSASYTNAWHRLGHTYKNLVYLTLAGIIYMIIASQRFLLEGIAYHNWGKEVVLNKFGYQIYSIYFLVLVIVGFRFIYKALKKSTGQFKVYLKFLFLGLVLAFSLGATFNLFYPEFGNYRYIWVGPLFTVLYISLISYAIVKHKLFDIRTVVVRTFAYILTLIAVGFLVILPALLIINNLLQENLSLASLAVLSLMALMTALLFQSARPYFDRITNKFFYRDYYDPQQVLDNLSKLLVGSVDYDEIKQKSTRILGNAIKPEFLHLYIKSSSDEVLPQKFIRNLSELKNDIILIDEVNQARHPSLYRSMRDSNTALVARLYSRHQEIGYMLLGYKRSGSPYTESDLRLIGIVADEVAVGLQNALRFREIQQFNVTLQAKVDEATKKLSHANTRLKELDKTKDEFISMASHQLRTPLTTIKGYLSMILEGDAGAVKKQQKDMIQLAFDSAENMVDLIADLLNVSRLQSGKFVIENKPTQLADMVEKETKRLQEAAATKKIELTFDKPKSFPVLNLDETKIRQVVMNFIDNALYYTPSGGKVKVELSATSSTILFQVTDTGVGVPKEVQHHLFTKFYRADNARKMRPDGTGLGLFMAKKVIVAQGGAIILQSEEGKGSTFGFSFPKYSVEVK